MPLHWQPVGPLPPSVYWRRRAAVIGIPLVLLLALTRCGGDGADRLVEESPSPSGSPSAAAPAATRPATAAPAGPATCPDAALQVTAAAERTTYARGETPKLLLVVKNGGSAACSRALGRGAVELLISSGSDRFWSSDDCAPGGDDGVVVLRPGQEVRQSVTWSGKRSAPGCGGTKAAADVGTYRVTARLGDLRVQGGVIRIR